MKGGSQSCLAFSWLIELYSCDWLHDGNGFDFDKLVIIKTGLNLPAFWKGIFRLITLLKTPFSKLTLNTLTFKKQCKNLCTWWFKESYWSFTMSGLLELVRVSSGSFGMNDPQSELLSRSLSSWIGRLVGWSDGRIGCRGWIPPPGWLESDSF